MINLGSSPIASLKLGSTDVTRVMLGTAEVWSSWSPLDLAPALWLDASDASTLYDATTGGNIVAPNGAVARWEDKSGNARHATQTSAGSRPSRIMGALNALGGVLFNGSSSFMTGPTTFAGGTVMIVFKAEKNAALTGQYTVLMSTSAPGFRILQRASATVFSTWPTEGGLTVINQGFAGIAELSGSNFSSGLVSTLMLNGAVEKFPVDSQPTGGSGYYFGYEAGYPARNFNGYLCEILIFPSTSATDRNSARSYLAAKWGIAVA